MKAWFCIESINRACIRHPLDKTLIPGFTYCQTQSPPSAVTEAKAKDGVR